MSASIRFGGLLLVLSMASGTQAAVQNFEDQSGVSVIGTPFTVSATLSDTYLDAKPIQHEALNGFFPYWYVPGPNFENAATISADFGASLEFVIDSPDTSIVALEVGSGFSVDRGMNHPISLATVGQIEITMHVLNAQSQVVTTHTQSFSLHDSANVGLGMGFALPNEVGQHFTVQTSFRILQQGSYFSGGSLLDDRYLFTGFEVRTTPVPEPATVMLAVGGLACLGVCRRHARKALKCT